MNNPPITKETLNRLISEGYSKEKAKELIALVVTAHLHTMVNEKILFNEALYIQQLKQLPKLPYDEDE